MLTNQRVFHAALCSSNQTMLLFCNVELAFYLAQWEEYHTGTLNWSNGWFGVTESQLTQMLLFCMTGIFGLKASSLFCWFVREFAAWNAFDPH